MRLDGAEASLRSSLMGGLRYFGRNCLTRKSSGQFKFEEMMITRTVLLCCLGLALSAPACAADVQAGQQLAQLRCAACHVVAQDPGRVVADAPPFRVIARKFAADPDALVLNLMGPHSKMNFRLTRPDAENIAAYIRTLAQ